MEITYLVQNIIDQIKEAQLKLGYAKEKIRLYYPVTSLCGLLHIENCNAEALLKKLENTTEFENSILGKIDFMLCAGNRIEVVIHEEGVTAVHEKIPDAPFLESIIKLFGHDHAREDKEITIEDIWECFKTFNENYICEKMKEENDFDYVLYFPDGTPDAWYYCIKFEMNHVIYHRFTKEDYLCLIAS